MNALRKFALTVHKNYLAASGKKRSLKANMLAALSALKISLTFSLFYETGVSPASPPLTSGSVGVMVEKGGIGQTATASYQFLLFTLAENVYTKFGIDPQTAKVNIRRIGKSDPADRPGLTA